jgi:hypothetical protein
MASFFFSALRLPGAPEGRGEELFRRYRCRDPLSWWVGRWRRTAGEERRRSERSIVVCGFILLAGGRWLGELKVWVE